MTVSTTRMAPSRVGPSVALVLAVLGLALAGPASGAAPGWLIQSVPQPTVFSSEHDAQCETLLAKLGQGAACDSYRLLITNVGAAQTNGSTVVVADELPPGVKSVVAFGRDLESNETFRCDTSVSPAGRTRVECSDETPIAARDALEVTIDVTVAPGEVNEHSNYASVAGGGARATATDEATSAAGAGGGASLGIVHASVLPFNENGELDTQAGGHPHELVTSVFFNSTNVFTNQTDTIFPYEEYPDAEPRDVVVDLPVGLVGNPQVAEKCPLTVLAAGEGHSNCPAGSRVGTIIFEGVGNFHETARPGGSSNTSALYNLQPEAGFPAEFGFTYLGQPVIMYASLVHTLTGETLRVAAPGLPEVHANGVQITFFGDPATENGTGSAAAAFFDNPVDCANHALNTGVEADSWEETGAWAAPESGPASYPTVEGCDALQFAPTIAAVPDTAQADEPSGLQLNIKVPSAANQLSAPVTPELRTATITLPAGMTLAAGAADGLRACPATGTQGFNLGGNWSAQGVAGDDGLATETGVDGLPHIAPGHCPPASTLGTVEVSTPLLTSPLHGHLYLAEPQCGGTSQPECRPEDAQDGKLFRLYLEAAGSGVIVKQQGTASVNPTSGQITTTFRELPELPFDELRVHLNGGPRATLATPQSCGTATTTSDLVPWSAPTTPDGTPATTFTVSADGSGAPCPAAVPFKPGFSAGTASTAAGGFSPFVLSLSRGDREQDLAGVGVQLPAGLLGLISKVPLCEEPQAAAGTCGSAALVGSASAAAGSGSHPFWVTDGRVYLTGPYNGAPYGLSIVVPAVAGPFNLGNVVVRAAITVDPATAAVTITNTQPLPQIIDGVPLRLQQIVVLVDRPGFIFNPTSCAQKQITATVAGSAGARAAVSTPFAIAGCTRLPFKPTFAATTTGRASKANGASLTVKVTSKGGPQATGGEANIKSVKVDLPKQLPSRLTTLQKACVAKVFEANPAACPKESNVGTASASTPVLAHPLSGPAYLVSHGGAAFPDLEIVLQGEGVTLILDGNTQIKHGITSSTFKTVPDAPISSFELRLPTGRFSVLGAYVPAKANYSLCGQTLNMPTAITGQNGAVVKQTTKIAISGCPKAKAAKRKAGASRQKARPVTADRRAK